MAGHITPVGTGRTMMMERERERPPPPDQQLKCPRCDSTNTKFCYYNNYSLAQPRHFCKACKRYWTRGGTLRSVPVGGGCRKNKRVKKSTASSAVDSHPLAPPPPPSLPIPSRRMEINPMLYPLPSTMGLISIPPCTGAYHLQPPLDGLGLGFLNDSRRDNYHHSALESSMSQFQQLPTSQPSIMHDYHHQMFGSSCTASFFQGQPAKEVEEYGPLLPYDDHLLASSSMNGNPALLKQVKDEGDFSADWRLSCQNSLDTTAAATAATAGACDSSFLYWSPAGWPDTTCGSSVAPLI